MFDLLLSNMESESDADSCRSPPALYVRIPAPAGSPAPRTSPVRDRG